jgi:hypothetical protein
MGNEPLTLTQPELEPCDPERWTAILVDRPVAVLIATRPYVGVLIAKDAEQVSESQTILRGVRWVRLPTGLRRAAARWASRWLNVRLPAEWLFETVSLEQRPREDTPSGVVHVASLSPQRRGAKLLPHPSPEAYPVYALTHRQYHVFAAASGRILDARVRDVFRTDLQSRRPRRYGRRVRLPFVGRRRTPFAGQVFAG